MSTTEITITVTLIACTILICFLIWFLIAARCALKKLDTMLEHATAISSDLENKLKELEPFFRHANKLGESIEQKHCCAHKHEGAPVAELIDWALLGTTIWQKFTTRR